MSTQYKILGAAKYDGRCVCCSREARHFEAVLVQGEDKKFGVAHCSCAGVRMKNKIGGGRVQVSGPATLTVEG